MTKISIGGPVNRDFPVEPTALRALIRRAGHTGQRVSLRGGCKRTWLYSRPTGQANSYSSAK
jgi:hypothetical protein